MCHVITFGQGFSIVSTTSEETKNVFVVSIIDDKIEIIGLVKEIDFFWNEKECRKKITLYDPRGVKSFADTEKRLSKFIGILNDNNFYVLLEPLPQEDFDLNIEISNLGEKEYDEDEDGSKAAGTLFKNLCSSGFFHKKIEEPFGRKNI